METSRHINFLELLVTLNALKSVFYINKCGGTKSKSLNDLSLELLSENVSNYRESMNHGRGSVCIGLERSTKQIRFLETSTRRTSSKRFLSELEFITGIRIPAIQFNSAMSEEDNSRSCVNLPSLANSTMVSSYPGTGVRHTVRDQTATGCSHFLPRAQSPIASEEIIPVDHLEVIRNRLCERGFPEEVVEILLEGNRRTSSAAYQTAGVAWRAWCIKWNKNSISNDLTTILTCLTHLFSPGKSFNTINVHRSMISMTLEPLISGDIGKDRL